MKLTLADVWDFDNDIRWYVAEEVNDTFQLSATVDHYKDGVVVTELIRTFDSQLNMMRHIADQAHGTSTLVCVRYEDGHVALQRFQAESNIKPLTARK